MGLNIPDSTLLLGTAVNAKHPTPPYLPYPSLPCLTHSDLIPPALTSCHTHMHTCSCCMCPAPRPEPVAQGTGL